MKMLIECQPNIDQDVELVLTGGRSEVNVDVIFN